MRLLLNFSFVFAGSAGVNPAFMLVGMFLVLAWRNAGWLGSTAFVLPALGTPLQRGPLATRGFGGRGKTGARAEPA